MQISDIYRKLIKEYQVFLRDSRSTGDVGAARYWLMAIKRLRLKLNTYK